MTRYDEVKRLIAARFAKQIMAEVPVSSPQTVDALADDICEWMAGLHVFYVNEDELRDLS